MKRTTARKIHEITNLSFWFENPEWDPGGRAGRLACGALRVAPFSVHEGLKRLFYDSEKVLAVSGETVVAKNGAGKVDKFMFRYPDAMPLTNFYRQAEAEIAAVVDCLPAVALSTEVALKAARIFRSPQIALITVAQTQPRLDLATHAVFNLAEVRSEPKSPARDNTALGIEHILTGTIQLANEHGYYPDIAHSAGNLRRNTASGLLTLIDVMPVYYNGGRLIDDGANILPHVHDTLASYEDFVGEYGA